MGACVKASVDDIHPLPNNRQLGMVTYPQTQQNSYRIVQFEQQLILKHSPLYLNLHLKKLFDTNSQIPEEISFNYSLKDNYISVGTSTEIRLEGVGSAIVWTVYNAKENIHPPTQITTKLKQFSKCFHQKIVSKQLSVVTIKIDGLYHVQNKTDLIMIIESTDYDESRYMIYSFELQKTQLKLIKQSYNWCSLSFNIQSIYGAMQDEMNTKAMQLCAICITNTANTMFVPCRHMCVCQDCGKTFTKTIKQTCPICRKVYTNLIAYISQQKQNQI